MSQLEAGRKRKLLAITTILIGVAAVGAVGVFYYSCVSGGVCFGGGGPREYLALTNYNVDTSPGQQNPTVLNLWLMSTGSDTVVISSLSITDVNGGNNQVSLPVSASIPPQTTKTVTVDTSTSGFYFTPGHAYTIIVSTSHNQFAFQLNYS